MVSGDSVEGRRMISMGFLNGFSSRSHRILLIEEGFAMRVPQEFKFLKEE